MGKVVVWLVLLLLFSFSTFREYKERKKVKVPIIHCVSHANSNSLIRSNNDDDDENNKNNNDRIMVDCEFLHLLKDNGLV